jgi:predicted nucleic acid-binding protein
VLSNHLLFEYEEILKRQATDLNLSFEEVDELLNAICARAETWTLLHGWRPILNDSDDEPLVQLAVESNSYLIVTHNLRDLRPATGLGVEVLPPREFLAKLRL